MKAADILELGLVELATLIREGDVTSEAATLAVLEALAQRGEALGAVARLHRDEALTEAVACDRDRARGRIRGCLHGVPLAHKDMFHRAGRLSELGSLIFRGHVPTVTATVLHKLDAAGAIDVGRLNMVEFALGVTGHNDHTGHPRNAWDPSRITGGSSSGGATAVAARLIPATLGSDTGGSIRLPAALCGLVGLKPTYGRVSRANAMPLSFSLDHVGPLCRKAADAALMLEVIGGHDPLDRSTSRRPVERYGEGLDGGLEGLRLTVARDGFEDAIEPPIEQAAATAYAALRQLGARVEERRVPAFSTYNALRRLVASPEIAALHSELVRIRRQDYNPTTLSRMLLGHAMPGPDYTRALAGRGWLLREFCREVFSQADILALPTSPITTPTIAATDTKGDHAYVTASNRLSGLIGIFNYLGLPALSMPMGFDAAGMPMGLQIVARPFAEALLLRVAHAYERATGWPAHRPALT